MLTLQDDAIYVCYNVTCSVILDRHLGFHFFLETSKIAEIITKSSQNAYKKLSAI